MSEVLKGSPNDYNISTLDEKYQELLQIAKEQLNIEIVQSLKGGYSGAHLYLAKVNELNCLDSKLVVLKLDHYDKNKNEQEQHDLVLHKYSDKFRSEHLVEMAFPAITLSKKRRIALFYEVAGQSLTDFRSLREFDNKKLINLAFKQITTDLLDEWAQRPVYHDLRYGFEIIRDYFECRYSIQNNNIEEFLTKDLSISPDDGILIGDNVLPSVYNYFKKSTPNKAERKIALPLSVQHGDLNEGNILIPNPRIISDKLPYYLIDFLHFNPDGCSLFDILSLEFSLIVDYLGRSQVPVEMLLQDVSKLGNLDLLTSDFSLKFGQSEIHETIRKIIIEHIEKYGKSYKDDWKASFNLSGIAVGLIAVNIEALNPKIRALAYVYAASHLKSFQDRFGIVGFNSASTINLADKKETQITAIDSNSNFSQFYDACNFISQDQEYIGVFGVINGFKPETLQVFSRIPWSAVIDFDPNSEKPTKLLGCVKELLNQKRSVHLLIPQNINSNLNLNLSRVCYWFAARGLSSNIDTDSIDLSWKYWNRQYSRSLEDFIQIFSQMSLKLITVVIFWDDPDGFIEDVIKIMVRYLDDRVKIILAHPNAESQKILIQRFDIKPFSIDLTSIANGLRFRLPADNKKEDDIILPSFVGLNNKIEYISLPIDIFNWIEEDCELLHINLAVSQKSEIDENASFLRGRRINWFELNLHVDIERDLSRDLLSVLEESLSKRERTTYKLVHHPGAGGTTIASRVAWELHWTYPVLILKHFSTSTIDIIRDVYNRTQQSVLVVIDSSYVPLTNNLSEMLFDKLLTHRIPAVLLIVVRDFDLPHKSDHVFVLNQQLSNQEAFRFSTILSREAPLKQGALEKLVSAPQSGNQRTPFIFGLTAYEEEFDGIERFVETRLQNISEQERLILVFICIVDYFSNLSVNAQLFGFLIGLPPSRVVNLRDYLNKCIIDMLIFTEDGWRPLHVLVTEEILHQLLSKDNDPERWTEMLPDYACKVIELLSNASVQTRYNLNLVVNSILRGLFIDRQDADSENLTLGEFESKFSNFIEAVPTIEGRRIIFDKLVDEFDNEPHFWGHRSRFIMHYAKDTKEYEEAVTSINNALRLSSEEDSILYHIKGMALAKWATHLMTEVNRNIDSISKEELSVKLADIEDLVQKALGVFKHIRENLNANEERAYVSAIELLTRYIEFGQSISPFTTFADFFKSPKNRKYCEYLQDAENLLNLVRRLKFGFANESRFVRERQVYIEKLYDNYSQLISGLWELVNKNDLYRPRYRRSLAYAYLARSGRDWDKVEESDLKKILELMEENFLIDPSSFSHNLRIWFEAARRLPNTSIDFTIQKLTQWVNIANNKLEKLDAYYYLYTLQTISAIEGSETASIQAQRSLEMSKQLSQDRPNRTISLDWVGKLRGVSRLVPRSRLGKFQQDTTILGNQVMSLLAPLTGRISIIQNGQKGYIKAYGINIFFTPRPRSGYQFVQGRDDNLPVTFFCSFSYDGPIAHTVEPIKNT